MAAFSSKRFCQALLQRIPAVAEHQNVFPQGVAAPAASLRQWLQVSWYCAQAAPAATDHEVPHQQASGHQVAGWSLPPPKSLAWDRPVELPKPEVANSTWGKLLLNISGFYSKESQHIRGARNLYQAVTEQAADDRLYKAFDLQRKFANEYNMLCLHMWLLLVRLRQEGKDGRDLAQMVHENFQHDVEVRVRAEGVKVRLGKWLTELEQMFYGMSFAFDQALRGEQDLTDALLRNIYGNDPTKRKAAARLEAYLRRELSCLKRTGTPTITEGRIKFSSEVF